MRSRVLIAFAAGLALVAITPWLARADLSKLDPLARRTMAQMRAGATASTLEASRASAHGAAMLDVFITGSASRAMLEAAGAIVRTELPGVCTAYVPADRIEQVAGLAGVRHIHGSARVKKLLDASVPTTSVNLQRSAGPTFTGVNGAGVVVGLVDTGVDYDNEDFKNVDGTTRILRLWDQTDAVGPAATGFGYGSEWTSADINSHVAREIDADGHGTHVLGIAAGDGSSTGNAVPAHTYVGMAPKADLIVVETDFEETGIVDGVAYVMNRAAALGKNAVVNLSLGSLYGPKDGTSPFETAIAALTGPGRIVVVAAGNDGNYPVHAEVVAPAGGTTTATFSVPTSGIGTIVALDGYYAAGAPQTVRIQTPNGTSVGPIAVGGLNAAYPGTSTSNGFVYLENGVALTATGDRQVYVEVNVSGAQNAVGTWTMTFTNGSGTSGSLQDETSEDHTAGQWSTATATPGTVAGGVSGSHLLISEVGMRGVNSATLSDSTEFFEIHNPTGSTVSLSDYYVSDVNGYAALPVAGTINLAGTNTDYAMRFPASATIAAGATKVIAVNGGSWKRGRGTDADFMMFNPGGGATTALPMVDVATNKGAGYPGFGSLTNGAEFAWLFRWDGASDLVCDVDLVYWGSGSGANAPSFKSGCQDGPDAGSATSCYGAEAGNPSGSFGRQLSVPSNGSGTRQRTGPEGGEAAGGNSCLSGPPVAGTPIETDLWIFYDTELGSVFVVGADPTHQLVAEPACTDAVISVGAWVTKANWIDCGGRTVSFATTNPVGDIADFSSPGPTRDGRQKPDLVAPGMAIGSSTSFDVAVSCPGTPSDYLNDGSRHRIEAGTSMAAPHVTGAVAVLLQKLGALTPAQAKSYLQSNAATDAFTGGVWNRFWGFGKLKVGDLSDPVAQVTLPNGGEIMNIGTQVDLTWNATDPYLGVTGVDLRLTRDNGSSWEAIATNVANSGSYSWSVTGPGTAAARLEVTARDAAANAGRDSSDSVFTIAAPTAAPGEIAIRDFELSIPSGNPSMGSAVVAFAVPRAGDVKVELFDVSGRIQGRLASGAHAAGRYQVRWNASAGGHAAPAGVYFVRLVASGSTLVRRFVLAR